MAQLQDLVPGGQEDIWGEVLEANLNSINVELIDVNQRLTAMETNGSGAVNAEGVRDILAATLRATDGVKVIEDDAGDTITVSLTNGIYPLGSPQNPVRSAAAGQRPGYIPSDIKCYFEGTAPFNPASALPIDEIQVLGAVDTAPPSVPSNFTATAGDGKVDLSWGASVDAVSSVTYKVYRDAVVIASNLTTLAYSDTGRTNGTAYAYKVGAVDASGNESQTAVLTRTPTATAAPVVTIYSEDFTTGTAGWVTRGSTTAAPTHDATRDGGSLKFVSTAAGAPGVAAPSTLTVPPSTEITVVVRMSSDVATAELFNVTFDEFTAAGTYVTTNYTQGSKGVATGTGFSTLTVKITTTATTERIKLLVEGVAGTAAAAGEAYYIGSVVVTR